MRKITLILFSIFIITSMNAQDIKKLPEPIRKGGMPLMEALNLRKTDRDFSSKELDPQTLSNLLWAANGINRPDGRRTAPTARNMQQIEIYLYMQDGVYLYLAKEHALQLVVKGDHRKEAAKQPFAQEAPVTLVLVADYVKMNMDDKEARDLYAGTDCGNVCQNIYLFCASENLCTVELGMIDREAIEKLLKLNGKGKVLLGQPVGYHK